MTSDTAWMRDESLRPLEARLARSAAPPRVVSFDFFDTLVLRLCAEPSHLFIELGRQLARKGMLRVPLSPSEYRSVRMAGEEKAREGAARAGAAEVTLTDIYRELQGVLSDPVAAQALEFSVERSLCFVNRAVASLILHVRNLGCRTAIVADTHWTSGELFRLLEEQNLPRSLFDAVFVSSERGKSKSSHGTLYLDLLKQFDLHPGELLHIGHSMNADVLNARRFGIGTHRYYRTNPALKAIFTGERRLLGPVAPPAGSLEALRVLSARQGQDDDDAFRDGALVLGPLLSRFADWAVQKYVEAGVRRVLAPMREGELLGELLRRKARAAGVPLDVVTCQASHMSTARAAMPAVNVESAAMLLDGASLYTPQTILELLGLGAEAADFLDRSSRYKPLPSREAGLRFLRAVFQLPRVQKVIELRQRESQKLAFEYLSSLLNDESTIGMLDLGWSGSVQGNIAAALRLGGRDIRTVGCYLACPREAGRLALDGHEVHAYLEGCGNLSTRSAILLRACITACVGNTTGYAREGGGQVKPVLDSDPLTTEQRAIKARLHAGVLAFQTLWLDVSSRKEQLEWSNEFWADLDRQSPAILHRWTDFPTKPEADRVGALSHEGSNDGEIQGKALCDEESRMTLRRDGAESLFRHGLCAWPQGVMAQIYPRLVSVMRNPWDDPLAMGRLGASHGLASQDGGLTADELASLAKLLGKFAPSQVVFCGSAAPVVIAALRETAPALGTRTGLPWLIFAGAVGHPLYVAEGDAAGRCVEVRGRLDDPATLAAIRPLLDPGTDAVLVLTGDVSKAEASPVLHGLAPFLGPRGLVLIAHGRYDRPADDPDSPPVPPVVEPEHPLEPPIRAWFESTSARAGFGLWNQEANAHLRNWTVLVHAPDEMVWGRQWMPNVPDLAYGTETPAPRALGSGTHR